MKEVRTIIWDLDETVWFYNNNETRVLCKSLNINQEDAFAREYYKMWGNLFIHFKDKIVTYDGVKQFIEKEMPILQLHHISADTFLQVLCEKKQKIADANPEAIEMIKYCYEKGLKNISITDWFVAHQKKALSNFNVLNYIEKIYGCDNAYFKNSIEKVSQIKEELELEKRSEEFVIIGDSLTSDILFAKRLGIKSIWYNPKGKINETSIIPTLETSSLLQLKRIF